MTRRRRPGAKGRVVVYLALTLGILALLGCLVLLRFTIVTDYLYNAAVKDPERTVPSGPTIVSPADGTVVYVKEVRGGMVPEVVKRGVAVPVADLTRFEPEHGFRDGYLVGIYMNTFGVHINRIPNHGRVKRRILFNGPHMDMSAAERGIILTSMVPGLVTVRKLLRLPPYPIADDHDFVLKSARETLVLEDERGVDLYIVRIADYYVGKILTWVHEDEEVERGERMGLISWGSQTDLFIEETPGLELRVAAGDYVYGGETVLATY